MPGERGWEGGGGCTGDGAGQAGLAARGGHQGPLQLQVPRLGGALLDLQVHVELGLVLAALVASHAHVLEKAQPEHVPQHPLRHVLVEDLALLRHSTWVGVVRSLVL